MSTDNFVASLKTAVKSAPKSIILPETTDERVIEAIHTLLSEKTCKEVGILGKETEFLEFSKKLGYNFDTYTDSLRFFEKELDVFEGAKKHFIDRLKAKGRAADEKKAEKWASSPTNQASYLLTIGKTDCFVSGCITTTADVIRASLQGIGLKDGIKTLSGSFVMVKDEQKYVFADCGIVIDPSPDQLSDIAKASVETFEKLFPAVEPKVAFFHFLLMVQLATQCATKS